MKIELVYLDVGKCLLFQTSAGLNHRHLQRRPDKNFAAKLRVLNKQQSR